MRVKRPAAERTGQITENRLKIAEQNVDAGFPFGFGISDRHRAVGVPVPWEPAAPDQPRLFHERLIVFVPDAQLKLFRVERAEKRLKIRADQRVILQKKRAAQTVFLHEVDLFTNRRDQIRFGTRLTSADKVDDVDDLPMLHIDSSCFLSVSLYDKIREIASGLLDSPSENRYNENEPIFLCGCLNGAAVWKYKNTQEEKAGQKPASNRKGFPP